MNTSPAIDDYIATSAEFARPILKKIRDLFHRAHPEMQEELKWSFPHFVHKGIVGSMAAFKKHVSFGFWKAALMSDPKGILQGVGETSMGGSKVTSMDDLPADDVLIAYIREAVALNDAGIKTPKPEKKKPVKLQVPDDLTNALKKNKRAQKVFDNFSPSHQKEYVEWLTEAKQEATRKKRLSTAVEWMAEGKSRHWKYKNC